MKNTKFITVALMTSTLLLSTSVFAKSKLSAFEGVPSRDVPQGELNAVSGKFLPVIVGAVAQYGGAAGIIAVATPKIVNFAANTSRMPLPPLYMAKEAYRNYMNRPTPPAPLPRPPALTGAGSLSH